MTTEIINNLGLREYIHQKEIELYKLEDRLYSGEASKEEVQAFIEWRKSWKTTNN